MSSNYETMHQMLPSYYDNSPEMRAIIMVQGRRLDELFACIDDVRAQCNIDTATWALPRYEKIWGVIPYATDTTEDRRARIKAKMQATSPFTPFDFKEVLQIFFKKVEIVNNASDCSLTFVFESDGSAIKNFRVATDFIESYIPAHLNFGLSPTSTDTIQIKERVMMNQRRYHKLREFRIGMPFMKYQNEVEL